MRRWRWIAVIALSLVLAGAPPAHADRRVALVVGNSAYRYTPALDNPRNDAADMAAALGRHAFEVIRGIDLDKAAFDRRVGEFVVALKGADAGVFFYAGHGLQVAGRNYLVPIDAKAEEAALLDLEMVRVDTVHAIMERQTETNVLFLDACRDNPLARNLARSMGTRSAEVGRGLAEIRAGVGTLISFSTQPATWRSTAPAATRPTRPPWWSA
ncbi:MAG: caspase family protein [Hyphomicrobiaceae bacterium]|nr:caspase family protein [Hyphomicrobiaceae bacterium]